jgi:DNA-binding NtrC family response regulator
VALLVAEGSLSREALERFGRHETAAPAGLDDLFALGNFEEFKEAAERVYLERKLQENGWNIKRTAEVLGMQRSNLYKKIERYGLKGHGLSPESLDPAVGSPG